MKFVYIQCISIISTHYLLVVYAGAASMKFNRYVGIALSVFFSDFVRSDNPGKYFLKKNKYCFIVS